MNKWQIILAAGIFLAECQFWPPLQVAPAAPPYPTTGVPPVVITPQPQYLQGPAMIQSGAQPVAVYPPQSTVVPLPSQTPGSIFGPPVGAPQVMPATGMPPSVVVGPQSALPGGPLVVAGPPNPIMVPVTDENLAWDQIADVVDDYFKIAREQRARRSGEAWTEGRIETAPLDGATVLEPHRKDSVGSFNRWESTFQSIRRRATVRVIPDPNGYLVEVIVLKELEDLPKPERATIGPVAFDSDQTLPSQRLEEFNRLHASPKWIQLGRDPALEQRILADIHARLNGVTVPRSIFAE
jgi:hypothetical protein